MKRIALIALAIGMAVSASAQQTVVKEAQRAAKEGKSVTELIQILTPAFTNPETAGSSTTWMIPGQQAYSLYDKQVANKQLRMFKNMQDTLNHDQLLFPAYEYYMKALAVDTVVTPKGKTEAKNSKKILDTFVGHVNDYYTAGAEFFNAGKYDEADKAFGIFIDLTQMPQLKKALATNPMAQDSVVNGVAFNQGLAAMQNNDFKAAIEAYFKAIKLGYNKKMVYDYGMYAAQSAGLNDTLRIFAEMALPLYGKEDTQYIRQIANYYLQNKEYDKAYAAIDAAIEAEPDNSQLYMVKGIITEYEGKIENALPLYKQAYEKDNNSADAAYNYGRALYEKASKLSDEAPTTQAEYETYLRDTIKPVILEAIPLLEAAYQLNPDNRDTLNYLENAYYVIGDEKMYKDVQERKKY